MSLQKRHPRAGEGHAGEDLDRQHCNTDEQCNQSRGGGLLEAALTYNARGWPVLPLHSVRSGRCTCGSPSCKSPGKHPRTPHGLEDAQMDAEAIRSWWRVWPDANVGIRTGASAGIIVLDVDPRHGGDDSLANLVLEHGDLPATVEALTGGGGRHLVFAHPGGTVRNRAGLRPGLDVRCDGGYIVAPPSSHISGGTYRWRTGHGPEEREPSAMPAWLLALVMQNHSQMPLVATKGGLPGDDRAARCLAALLRVQMADAGDGSKRLFTAACRCVEHDLDDGQAIGTIRAYEQVRPFPRARSDDEILRRLRDAERTCTRGAALAEGRRPNQAAVDPEHRTWDEPQPLPDALPAVMAFDDELLPTSLRPWIMDIAERVQCPPDFPAVAAMVGLAAIVGRKIGIRPKRYDDWLVVPNLWGGVIGRPGIMKTPALLEPLKPLHRLEIDAEAAFNGAMSEYKAATLVAKERRKVGQEQIRTAIKSKLDAGSLAAALVTDEVRAPVKHRYLTNDPTVEKLGELLNENPNGLLVYRDELVGLLRSLDREGQEGARSFYLEAWNGNGPYTYDRIGRGTLRIEAAIVSIIGGIQPGPLSEYLRSAAAGGAGDDGLLQRFQLAVWPDVNRAWVNVDRWPDREAKNRAYEVYKFLDALVAEQVGAQRDERDPDATPHLRFSSEAQDLFDEWRTRLEAKVRSGEEHPAIEAHLAKYRSLIPSLALLIHLADNDGGPVEITALQRAIRWGEYLESHARRIFSQAIRADVAAASALARHVLAGDLQNGFALRDVYRPAWSGLASREEALAAVAVLTDLGWLQQVKEHTEGRDRIRHFINPRLATRPRAGKADEHAPGTDKTDRSSGAEASGGFGSAEPGSSRVLEEELVLEQEVTEWTA